MKTITRTRSIISGTTNIEHLYTIPNFPIYIGCTNKPQHEDVTEDLSFDICKDSGIVQLAKLIPLNILYNNYHSEALGKVWDDHHAEFLKFISLRSMENVLEIGGSNGKLAKSYLESMDSAKFMWTIIEPGPSMSYKNSRIKIIKDFFPSTIIKKTFSTIVHSHVIEHMYDPMKFINDVSNVISVDGIHTFSVPNLKQYLKNSQVNVMNFEHSIYLTEDYIDYLLKKSGFQILRKKYFREHSIFYESRFTGVIKSIPTPKRYISNRRLFTNYFAMLSKLVKHFNDEIAKYDGETYVFGAHVFTQFLIKMGVNEDRITAVLDNSKQKQGSRLYGTRLFVQSLENIRTKVAPRVIVYAGVYQDEIIKQLKQINSSVIIL